MHDIKWIRENPEAFDTARARRGLPPQGERLLALDDDRRAAIARLQAAQERRNAASKDIGAAMKAKDDARAEALKAEVARIKEDWPAMEAAEREAVAALDKALAELPNAPLDSVPDGRDENDNVEVLRWGEPRQFDFAPKEHFELGEALGLMDFEAAAKLSGARFVVNKGKLARLERALAQFMLDLHTEQHGYTEVNPPLLVRDKAMFGTAQLPKFEEDQFWAVSGEQFPEPSDLSEPAAMAAKISAMKENRYGLIPTAEVPLTNLAADRILDEAALPLRFTAGTYCFRAEAGAAGRDTRGMIRQHQFFKIELVSITTAEQALEEHERMTGCAEKVLQLLELPYRKVALCTGDMGFASQKTYDLEVWLPGQGKYREISSCSVCGDFQARRMNARYRLKDGKTLRFAHTLNGSGVAVGRALIAVMENYQQADGAIAVPKALQGYMGGAERIANRREQA
jgi:seryl-tRNA synthetase